jgi:TRAP-type uncharacterized transport system substrate-binding protein
LPKETYRQETAVTVIGVNNMLIVNSHMDEEQVFQITRAIYGHMEEFKKNNAIARQIDWRQSMRLPIPLHAGAARFFSAFSVESNE